MKNHVIVPVLATLVLCVSNSSAQQAASSIETMGEFTAKVPLQMAQPLVDYCAEQIPEQKEELEKEFSSFKVKFSDAIKPVMERLAFDPEFSAPVTEDTRVEFKKMNELMLSEIKQADPHAYCPALINRMHGATVEALRASVETSVLRYQQAKKESAAK
ncbi:MAG: hypothetical protein ACREO1_01630 [Arenimonas sp.]